MCTAKSSFYHSCTKGPPESDRFQGLHGIPPVMTAAHYECAAVVQLEWLEPMASSVGSQMQMTWCSHNPITGVKGEEILGISHQFVQNQHTGESLTDRPTVTIPIQEPYPGKTMHRVVGIMRKREWKINLLRLQHNTRNTPYKRDSEWGGPKRLQSMRNNWRDFLTRIWSQKTGRNSIRKKFVTEICAIDFRGMRASRGGELRRGLSTLEKGNSRVYPYPYSSIKG